MIVPAYTILSLTNTPIEFFTLHRGKAIFLLIFVYLIVIFYLVNRQLRLSRLIYLKNENIKEENNSLSEQIRVQKNMRLSLEQKIIYYNNLREITNKIQNLSLQEICQHLVNYAFFLLGKNKGCCLFYLVDLELQKLSLFLSKKEDNELVIKQKEGDVFDKWVIKHPSSLLVEDVKVDFRFDLEKTELKPERPVLSIISAPLRVEQRFLGILRLDNSKAHFYTQDDLRFLDAICNVGALGVENAFLFQRIQELAITDSLTCVYTKRYYLERLNEQIQVILREPDKSLSLMMIDIDYFKDYNDRYGHIAGDIVLKGLSNLFVEFFDNISGAMVCRFGGEEFSIFLPDISKERCRDLAQDLRREVQERRFILRRKETRVTVSIGVSSFSVDTRTTKDLILKADTALYQAKQKGRNQVCIM